MVETGILGVITLFTGTDFEKADDKVAGAFARLNDYKATQSAIINFKKGMEILIKEITETKSQKLPLFIIVDELDRCRPNFSIELLENIKHLFGVDGVYFVVATDTNQLGHSVQAIYGSNFNGRRYLQRFFDQEFTLPDPENRLFSRFLFGKHRLLGEEKFLTPFEQQMYTREEAAIEFFALSSSFFQLGLREQM